MGGPLEVAMQRVHEGGADRPLGEVGEKQKRSLRQRARGTLSKILGSSRPSQSEAQDVSTRLSEAPPVVRNSPSNDESFSPEPGSHLRLSQDKGSGVGRPQNQSTDSPAGVHERFPSVGNVYENVHNSTNEFHSGEHYREFNGYPDEFVCPILKKLMAEPVNVGSGISYERVVIQLYFQDGHRKCIKTGVILESDVFLKNSSLKTAIDHWCESHGVFRPVPPSLDVAREAVERACRVSSSTSDSFSADYRSSDGTSSEWSRTNSGVMRQIHENEPWNSSIEDASTPKRLFPAPWSHTWSEPQSKHSMDLSESSSPKPHSDRFDRSDSQDRVNSPSPSSSHTATHAARPRHSSAISGENSIPLPLAQTPASYGSEPSASVSGEVKLEKDVIDSLIFKLSHKYIEEQEAAAVELRRLTRISARHRLDLCTEEVFTPLLQRTQSRYAQVQINSVAAVMNISLERDNKLQVTRFGAIPKLVDVLKGGVPEAQEHAAGAIFSLALNDENKMAIGVLGAIPPLIHLLRSNHQGARRDAAMALYNLSLSQMNRSKLIRAGGVGSFLGIVRDERSDMVSRVLLILVNLAAMQEGRAALAEKDAVPILVSLLTKGDDETSPDAEGQEPKVNWPEVREHAAAALLQLSQHNFRFRSQALQAGALEGLQRLEVEGTPRATQKAAALISYLREPPGAQDGGFDQQAGMYPRRAFNRQVQDVTKAESSVF